MGTYNHWTWEWRWTDPSDSLTSQSSPDSKLQVQPETLSQKPKVEAYHLTSSLPDTTSSFSVRHSPAHLVLGRAQPGESDSPSTNPSLSLDLALVPLQPNLVGSARAITTPRPLGSELDTCVRVL